MSYSDLLKARREVLSEDGVEGITDLANLADRKKRKIEARPADFLDLTYPTADVRRVLTTIDRRFTGHSDAPGLFLFEGLKGSGKSHLLLMAYHLFTSRPAAQGWLGRHALECHVPQDTVVVINKFTDLPLHSIWDFVFENIRQGDAEPARAGRTLYRKTFEFGGLWRGRSYRLKQVATVVADEPAELVVVTVYAFYF